MAMMIGNRAYHEVTVRSNADGTRLSATLRMTPEVTLADVQSIFREFERLSHDTVTFRVINAPNYDVADLFDDDWHFKTKYTTPIPMTNLSGKHEYSFYEMLGVWNPYDAQRFEEYEAFEPYLCTVYVRNDDGAAEYDPESVRYNDVFSKDSFDSIAPDYDSSEDIGVYVVEELNSGLCVPLTECSQLLWKYDDSGWEVTNRITVESRTVKRREELRQAIVNGDVCARELPQGNTSDDVARREQYREACLDAEIARDENLLTRALGGADLHEEFETLALQARPLVEPK